MSFEISLNPEEISSRREKINKEIEVFKKSISEKYNGIESEKILDALNFMLEVHLPQDDRFDGRPFAGHPIAVAEKVMELSDNAELVVAALIHDSVEDRSDSIFVERIKRKYPDRNFLHLPIDEILKNKYKDIFKDWSFKEIRERFGDNVAYYTESMTNHDFNSLADGLGLSGENRQDFINKLYGEHVEEIINNSELFILKLADLSVNIDLHSLEPNCEKYLKLKRKYKSVIEAFLEKLKNLDPAHPIYKKREAITSDLDLVYREQYNK